MTFIIAFLFDWFDFDIIYKYKCKYKIWISSHLITKRESVFPTNQMTSSNIFKSLKDKSLQITKLVPKLWWSTH